MRRRHDFEPELLARITHPGRVRRPRRRIGAWWWQIPLVALFAALLAGAWWLFPSGHDGALATLAQQVAASLQTDDPAASALRDDPTLDAHERERLRDHFEHITHTLEEQGIRLENAHPLAYGGARARVSPPGATNPGVWASIGNLYLDANGTLIAIEYGARRDNRAYRLTDLWTAQVLGPASLVTAESHARQAYRAFLEQDNAPATAARLRSTRFVFFSLR